jgi:hypothetical protein
MSLSWIKFITKTRGQESKRLEEKKKEKRKKKVNYLSSPPPLPPAENPKTPSLEDVTTRSAARQAGRQAGRQAPAKLALTSPRLGRLRGLDPLSHRWAPYIYQEVSVSQTFLMPSFMGRRESERG